MTILYSPWFTREYDDREDTELQIGIYATEADAVAAVAGLVDQPGFRDYPEGFEVHPATLGETGWTKGFVTEWIPLRPNGVRRGRDRSVPD
jgi:homoserine kinase type II